MQKYEKINRTRNEKKKKGPIDGKEKRPNRRERERPNQREFKMDPIDGIKTQNMKKFHSTNVRQQLFVFC